MAKHTRKLKPIDLDIDDLGPLVLFSARTLRGSQWLKAWRPDLRQWLHNALCAKRPIALRWIALAKQAGLRVKRA